jgi:PadR family transcriptional regulator PadR
VKSTSRTETTKTETTKNETTKTDKNKTRSSHWLHGFLDLCLLGLLGTRRDYGYELGQRLKDAGFDDVPGGTLYPALLRLERQALVAVSWEASAAGPRRKYYDLTEAGRSVLADQLAEWRRFSQGIDLVTVGENQVGENQVGENQVGER